MDREKLVKKVKEVILDVYDTLGSGHTEYVYENAVKVGLRLLKIPYEDQRTVVITYKGFYVGDGRPDIIVKHDDGDIIIELKSITRMGGKEEMQLRTYMHSLIYNLSEPIGLLVNMQAPSADIEKETAVEIKEIRFK